MGFEPYEKKHWWKRACQVSYHTFCNEFSYVAIHDEWNASQWSNKAEGKEIVEKVYEKAFWKRAEEIVLFSAPLVKVLRMVGGDKPTMGFIYEAMDQAKEKIKEAYEGKRQKYLPLWRIIDDR